MATEENIPGMLVDEFCDFLSTKFDDDMIAYFRSNKICGGNFTKLSEWQLEKLVTAVSVVVELQMLQEKVKKVTAHHLH